MYARYIPPTKSKPPPRADHSESFAHGNAANGHVDGQADSIATSGLPAPPPPIPSDSFSYARYVPKARASSTADESSDVGRKRKRAGNDEDREEKKARDELEDGEPARQEDSETTSNEKAPAALPASPEPEPKTKVKKDKSKKEKKSKKNDGEDADVDMLDADVTATETAKKVDAANANGEEEGREAGDEEEDDSKRRKEEKRRRKEEKEARKRRKAQEEEPPGPSPQDEDIEMTAAHSEVGQPDGEAAEESEKKTKKEKKEKKKKKKQTAAEEAEPEVPDEKGTVAKAHQAILDKKAKAMKTMHLLPPEALVKPTDGGAEGGEGGGEEPARAEMHGLQPLPQPEPVDFGATQPAFDALPSWISEPVRVEEGTRVAFTDLGIPEKVARALNGKGYKDAFAVQTAVIPLLLPTAKRLQGDVLVSAATGSGKTLAYAIPIVQDISQGVVTRLRALVVLPTRELVKQAKEAFEACAGAFDGQGRKRVRIGIAYGSQAIRAEQHTLIAREERYDPEAYKAADDTDEEEHEDEDARDIAVAAASRRKVARGALPDHVLDFSSTVDVLICTPGRLVDHIRQTRGFSLDYVRWLVVDEGDKLLEQNYQNWIPVVMAALKPATGAFPSASSSSYSSTRPTLGARDFPNSHFAGVRKVFLSATLTSKGSLAAMAELELQRPQLVVLGGPKGGDVRAEHVLPDTLREAAVRVRDENLKPLFLHELLMSSHMRATAEAEPTDAPAQSAPSASSSSSSSSSDSDTSDSESGSDADSDSDAGSDTAARSPNLFPTTALIFTKSNEAALRLSRLLILLNPALAPLLGTLTSATPPHLRRRTISLFSTRRLRLLVASDLVARGIDLPRLDHVVNYDLPPSLEAYVHRVGRAARAGRAGCAWTLVPDGKEGGWFWGEVVRGRKVARSAPVARVRLGAEGAPDGEVGEDRIAAYEAALAVLAKEASAGGGKRK